MRPFLNRSEAGKALAKLLASFKDHDPIVVALPRGGLPVAAEIAKSLHAPLEVLGVKKVSSELNPEYALGAVTEDGTYAANPFEALRDTFPEAELSTQIRQKQLEAAALGKKLRRGRELSSFQGQTVLIVDDGLATGATALAAAKYLRNQGAKNLVFASPVCARESVEALSRAFDSMVCVLTPDHFQSVGSWYVHFPQLSDEDALDYAG